MSETANSFGSVMPRAAAAATTARRVAGRSSATRPTSVVSMWLDCGRMIITALRRGSNSSEASTMPLLAGRKSLSPQYGSRWL